MQFISRKWISREKFGYYWFITISLLLLQYYIIVAFFLGDHLLHKVLHILSFNDEKKSVCYLSSFEDTQCSSDISKKLKL